MNSMNVNKLLDCVFFVGMGITPVVFTLYVWTTIHYGVLSVAAQNMALAMFLSSIGTVCLGQKDRQKTV